MKKIFAIIMCALIMCALPVVAFAEGEDSAPVVETMPETEPTPEPTPEHTPDPTPEEFAKTTAEKIVEWVTARLDDISLVVTILFAIIYEIRKHKVLNKALGTLNNNAITIAEGSTTAIGSALTEVQGISSVVNGYKDEMVALLAEVRANAEEKQRLETALIEVETYLKTSKLANVELANEVAELLVLANIPNSKKEELYSRHLAAVGAIAEAEHTEVKKDDNEEA